MYNKLIKYMSIFVITLFLGGVGSPSCLAQAEETLEVGDAPSMADVPSPYVKDFNLQMKGNPWYNECVLSCYNGANSCRNDNCIKKCDGGTRDYGSGPVSTCGAPLSPEETATCMNAKCADHRRCADDCARKHNPLPNDPSPFTEYDKFTLYGDPFANNDVNHCWRNWGQRCRYDRCRDKTGQDLISCMEQKCKPDYDRCFADRERIRNYQ